MSQVINQNYYDISSVITDISVEEDFISANHNIRKLTDEGVKYAIQNGYIEIVKHFVQQGASIQALMDISIYLGQVEILKFALNQGAVINTDKIEIFIRANAYSGNIEMLKFLIDKTGQHKNHKLLHGLLMYAVCEWNQLNIVKLLTEDYNVDIHYMNDAVIKVAAIYGPLETFKFLVEEQKANIYACNYLELQTKILKNGGNDKMLYLQSKGLPMHIDPTLKISGFDIIKFLLEKNKKD